MNKFSTKKGIISLFLTFFVLGLLLISGPASALTLTLTQPNDAAKGSDVSFSTTVEVKDPDLVPIQYTTLTITGPGGFLKTCKINNDGTDDCADVDVTVSQSNVNSVSGAQYGYDAYLGTGYNLGNGFGYQSTTGTGTMTFDIVYHTPSTLTDGTYDAKADVFAQGSTASHTFSSSSKSFLISTPSTSSTGGGGGGGGTNEEFRNRNEITPTTPTTPITPTIPTIPVVENIPTGEEEVTPTTAPAAPTGLAALTGAAISALSSKTGKGAGIILLIIVLGLVGYYIYRKKNS